MGEERGFPRTQSRRILEVQVKENNGEGRANCTLPREKMGDSSSCESLTIQNSSANCQLPFERLSNAAGRCTYLIVSCLVDCPVFPTLYRNLESCTRSFNVIFHLKACTGRWSCFTTAVQLLSCACIGLVVFETRKSEGEVT